MREWILHSFGGGATSLAIIVAIIGLAGALGGAATSYIVAQKTVYINAITAERMKWVGSLRSNIATLISHMTTIQAYLLDKEVVTKDKLVITFKEMNELGKTIELQLNPNGEIDRNIISLVKMLYKSTNKEGAKKIDNITDEIIVHARWLLKAEWERIKYEARNPFGKMLSYFKGLDASYRYRAFCSTRYPSASLEDFFKASA